MEGLEIFVGMNLFYKGWIYGTDGSHWQCESRYCWFYNKIIMKNIGGIGDICQNKFTLQRANLWQGWEPLAMWVKVLLILQQDNCEKNLEGLAIFIGMNLLCKGYHHCGYWQCMSCYIRLYSQTHHIDTYWQYSLGWIYFAKGKFIAGMGAIRNVSQGVADFTTG